MTVQDYCASKFAAIGLHESLSHGLQAEEECDGVKTTLVCPYLVDNHMFDGCKIRYSVRSSSSSCSALEGGVWGGSHLGAHAHGAHAHGTPQ